MQIGSKICSLYLQGYQSIPIPTPSLTPLLNLIGEQEESSCPLNLSMVDEAVFQVGTELWPQKHA